MFDAEWNKKESQWQRDSSHRVSCGTTNRCCPKLSLLTTLWVWFRVRLPVCMIDLHSPPHPSSFPLSLRCEPQDKWPFISQRSTGSHLSESLKFPWLSLPLERFQTGSHVVQVRAWLWPLCYEVHQSVMPSGSSETFRRRKMTGRIKVSGTHPWRRCGTQSWLSCPC